jgi:uncharacterized protein YqgC (DUF456 family)
MVELLTAVALALLVGGVVGSVLPLVPGPLLSVAGVLVYWYSTGYSRPGTLVLVALVGVGLVAVAVDLLAGALSAKAGGASTRTAVVAGVVGVALTFVAGPVGLLVGIAATVFLIEYRRTGDPGASLRTVGYTTAGVLGSALVQALVTGLMLAAMLAVVFL